ncbi:MAG: deoxyribose-phosphate aldolase [Elusimicrobia bacterium]|nr:deoxyribose-phosphate aldolase [Elusimicrobiota bacterium]
MNEAQLRNVVEEVVKALAAKGFLKAGKCECESGPKALRGEIKTSVGSAGKVFGNAASWGAAPAKGQFSALPPKAHGDEDDEDAHVDAKIIQAAGAARVSVCKPTKKGTDTARYVDHTLLKPNATQEEIAKLCEEARQFCFASVCVNPSYVAVAAQYLRGSGVKVCTVVGFPLGSTTPTVKAIEARDAMANGADEIDMVINIGALKSGNDAVVYDDIKSVREATRGKVLKVILETSLLSNEEKVRACAAAKKAGADFVKTSTGFGGGGATVEDIKLMRETVGPLMGVKASGGIRDAKMAADMIAAGATRLGTSASVAIVTDAKSEGKGY